MLTAVLQQSGVRAWPALVPVGTGRRLVAVGSSTTATALVAIFGFALFHAATVDIIGSGPLSPDLINSFVRAEDSVALSITVAVALLGFHVGWALLLIGLGFAKRVPWPVAFVGSGAALGSFVAGAIGGAAEAAAFVALAGVIGWLGMQLSRSAQALEPSG